MHKIPDGVPTTLFEAFAHISAIKTPSVDDFKVLVMLEAAGKDLYDGLASGIANDDVRALLARNGREELAHAHRVSRVIGKLTGTDYPVPDSSENPFLTAAPPPKAHVDKATLLGLAETEFGGQDFYEGWASNCTNEEAAALLRQNGREEAQHGARLQDAAGLL